MVMMIIHDALLCYFIQVIDYHQSSDIDPIDYSSVILNNTINEASLLQQGDCHHLLFTHLNNVIRDTKCIFIFKPSVMFAA